MNQERIGKFIHDCRKEQGFTQEYIAEKLGISDRAVSKWERGINMPDASLMLSLSELLGITVNELLSGEKIKMEKYNEKAEERLLEMAQKEEFQNKKLMTTIWTMLITSGIFYVGILLIASITLKEGVVLGTVICTSTTIFLIAGFIALRLEIAAGYYECKNCHHKFIPTFKEVMIASHLAMTRHLKCPKCGKRSWCKKTMR